MKRVFVCLLGILVLCDLGCNRPPMCLEEAKAEATAPDNQVTAVWFEGNCGATTGHSTHVNLRLSSASFKTDSENRIIDGQVLRTCGQAQLKLTWESPRSLLIECLNCPPDFKPNQKVEQWQGITINFRGVQSSGETNSNRAP